MPENERPQGLLSKEQLSLAVIEDLKGKGFSQSEIAEMFGVTRQAISWWKTHYGGKLTPREFVLKEFPFQVPGPMQTSPYKRLRDHGEYVATGGRGMHQDELRRLRSFYQKLRDENLVVEFDPEIPPTPGVSKTGGWAYRNRLPSDGDLLIRDNEHANITEEGLRIWRFPHREP
jgi:hypothetical protein